MQIRLLAMLALTMIALGVSAFAQTTPSPTPAPVSQPSPPPQMQGMQGMNQMGDMESMKRMADMCQEMMQKEKAAMPFIVGTSVTFGVLLFVALLLLIVLEIQWIKYWHRKLSAKAP